MASIWREIKWSFIDGNLVTKLIYVNLVVFLLVVLGDALASMNMPRLVSYLWMPTEAGNAIKKPWTLFTYMFTHRDIVHIFFNMLNLYWFGHIMVDFMGERCFLRSYIIGGLAGAVACLIWSAVNPIYGNMLGASASVLAIMTAVATTFPNYRIDVVFVGQVRLKYFALFFVVLYMLLVLGGSSNIGGNVAHIGGIVAGFLLARYWQRTGTPQRSYDWSVIKGMFGKKERSNMRVVYNRPLTDYEFNEQKAKRSREVDRILDKIKESGYESLTSSEKQTLFEESKR